jgi:hypothetical protein
MDREVAMNARLMRSAALLLPLIVCWGCRSPYYADKGALLGGATGAGVGAIVGNAVGNTGAGAVIGAGVGALSGAAIGSGMDNIEARNRAEIEARLGYQVAAGAVTMDDVIAMSKGGVADPLIINHIRGNGMAAPLAAGDLIMLQQQGVSADVIQAMQSVPRPVVVQEVAVPPPPVIVEEHYYGPHPYWGHGHPHYHRPHYGPRPGVSWGFSYSE